MEMLGGLNKTQDEIMPTADVVPLGLDSVDDDLCEVKRLVNGERRVRNSGMVDVSLKCVTNCC